MIPTGTNVPSTYEPKIARKVWKNEQIKCIYIGTSWKIEKQDIRIISNTTRNIKIHVYTPYYTSHHHKTVLFFLPTIKLKKKNQKYAHDKQHTQNADIDTPTAQPWTTSEGGRKTGLVARKKKHPALHHKNTRIYFFAWTCTCYGGILPSLYNLHSFRPADAPAVPWSTKSASIFFRNNL